MQEAHQIIQQTRQWIQNVVIDCNFCPFAAREMERNSVYFELAASSAAADILLQFFTLMEKMEEDSRIETAFLLLPEGWDDFLLYLDLVEKAEKLIEEQDFEGIFQVASFHPNYQFDGCPIDDPANFTNRSPYPMLHILREESVEKALEFYPGDPEEIPERNVRFAREKGLAYMKSLYLKAR
ncbi:DUF1415 domain-containing protein [Flavihumibacter sp. CACIAM 22H1]|uniref:DUF1415 domain-containing protein n=1 Tax=Flavihumibacter sp. CACIAM 22H1 TaxID=1812911 RepID=UPI0007A85BFA|nr:DUF1415 domain-containing protein [Flavihumibacter sp. CACIAM 22H1]KYP15044.1 MAG: hypothetical protein A1D16_01235 [Flavihumibacter sp. CACIAM 22H1]